MSTEIEILACSVVLGFVYLIIATAASTKARGLAWNLSARDKPEPALTGFAGRAARASNNFKETFPFFIAAVLVTEFVARTTGQINPLTAIGAHVYFWARVIYLPLYLYGVPVVRTFVWSISILGIAMVLSSAVLAMI
ncbi:MAPEG family protein [soil metagenome]